MACQQVDGTALWANSRGFPLSCRGFKKHISFVLMHAFQAMLHVGPACLCHAPPLHALPAITGGHAMPRTRPDPEADVCLSG